MKIKEIGEKIKIGIDKIGFAMPKYFLDIRDLAIGRNENANKFVKGLIQSEMSIAPVTEDIVALGASAAEQILDEEDKENIEMVIVGTESGIDQSKASAVFIHNLLEIQPFARCIEIKEACYGATAALNFAKNYIEQNENASVLVIASDIAKYGIDTPGESTQGAGSIAMLIKKEPRIAVINDESICQTRDIMDFWRPNYSDFPIVDGHFSTKQYLDCLTTTFEEYKKRYNQDLSDFDAFCFHLPFPKLGLKAINSIFAKVEKEEKNKFLEKFHASIVYGKRVGNIYTGSLYLSLLSLLENCDNLKAGDKIGMYSYGSGAVCEFFNLTLADNFKSHLRNDRLNDFDNRKQLSIEEYENMFFEKIILDEEGNCDFSNNRFIQESDNAFVFEKVENHKRIYKKIK
ncbi:hydroxymethylglutaryl-CoA synthase [Leptotrichia alba]|uniref:Hydroxymethylglutaryl-CoA synthase n=1 Tax=Leptotrichia alba TaxID=3239304 RepID=A0AB39V2Y7_9FUSO